MFLLLTAAFPISRTLNSTILLEFACLHLRHCRLQIYFQDLHAMTNAQLMKIIVVDVYCQRASLINHAAFVECCLSHTKSAVVFT